MLPFDVRIKDQETLILNWYFISFMFSQTLTLPSSCLSQLHLTLFSVCTFNPNSIPSLRPFWISHTSEVFSFFLGKPLAGGRKRVLSLFLFLWCFKFVISLMQSRPATCPNHRKPPPVTTEALSLRTKTQSLCLEKDWDEKMEGMRDGRVGRETETGSSAGLCGLYVEQNGLR